MKVSNDLSNLFDFTQAEGQLARSNSTGQSGVAKRMLRRTGTSSNVRSPKQSRDPREELSAPVTPKKLQKTRSDSIIDLTPGTPSSRGHSLSPSKSHSVEGISSPAVLPARPPHASTSVRTYAGSSRSFLVALPAAQHGSLPRNNLQLQSQSQSLDEDGDTQMDSQETEDLEIRESYTDLRTRWGVDDSEDDPRPPSPDLASPGTRSRRKGKGKQMEGPPVPLPNGMYNDLKSITELRSKGESRRFLDEVGYLFEGLDASAILGVRRGSALEIVTKLCDVEFARKAKAADFLGRIWDVLREAGAGNGDKILDAILAFFAALVSRDTRDIADLAAKCDLTPLLYDMLSSVERANDSLWLVSSSLSDAELRKGGISKAEKTLLTSLVNLVRKKSGLVTDGDVVSNRLLLSFALNALPSTMQSVVNLSSLLSSLVREIAPTTSRISAYASGLSILPALSPSSYLDFPSFMHADNCLRLMDAFLLGQWRDEDDDVTSLALIAARDQGLVGSLIALCAICDVMSRDKQYANQLDKVYQCLESALRVLINLTHGDHVWCQAVLNDQLSFVTIVRLIVNFQRQRMQEGTSASITSDTGESVGDRENAAASLDRQCLCLGLLTNLVQTLPESRTLVREISLDFDCKNKNSCVRTCRCASRVTTLDCLAQVYLQHCKSNDEFDPALRGHMAVLFGLLMQDCPENQRLLLSTLPGATRKQKLQSLVEYADEFSQLYAQIAHKALGSGENLDDNLAISEITPANLRPLEGASVASDIVSFLEGLRDHG
ncbi:hypothetical protein WOLCODRAFT_155076 [Wolfiporia cocos MD-104 SS10]|uniref:Wings apart-like protein C-terminal domain-containing protein n=1 Tax=Wolfiporia cocos (strain MD-104) TaxID=742152 RepID=A0A2H3JSW8_WOLCO|nr:hypothetical protein WOLCODRAFT_155076 [Wolfiporia cocos MD-104 SS10]